MCDCRVPTRTRPIAANRVDNKLYRLNARESPESFVVIIAPSSIRLHLRF